MNKYVLLAAGIALGYFAANKFVAYQPWTMAYKLGNGSM